MTTIMRRSDGNPRSTDASVLDFIFMPAGQILTEYLASFAKPCRFRWQTRPPAG